MKNFKEMPVVLLLEPDMININGGQVTQKTSFGEDVGYVLGWILSAIGKGASAIKG